MSAALEEPYKDDPMGRTNPFTGRPCGKGGCAHNSKRTSELCGATAIPGTDGCKWHSGKSTTKARARGQVIVELHRWGLGDATVDPGITLLRLVSQSSNRAELYAQLLGQAYDAAERLRNSEGDDAFVGNLQNNPSADLERVLNTGGVAALIGHTYAASKDGGVFAAQEAIRGLAQLEADERDRCANFSAKAIAAGLAERQVRLAEQQGAQVASAIRRVLEALGLSQEQQLLVPTVVPGVLREITAGEPL